eukprot:CAMPEP_0115639132 /NCGR_PEP_ID=MMETSP0272-20121206/35101_1 /TAXON_ID=71861 /ORGANISM="Scrippsiella trochoidea, Strain CCMP3099" /LENGTH=274 /DNA_ID=CAMNT_0003076307 /DNA_START=92 /DNA_END=917 /DNA_ORIENTATION=-
MPRCWLTAIVDKAVPMLTVTVRRATASRHAPIQREMLCISKACCCPAALNDKAALKPVVTRCRTAANFDLQRACDQVAKLPANSSFSIALAARSDKVLFCEFIKTLTFSSSSCPSNASADAAPTRQSGKHENQTNAVVAPGCDGCNAAAAMEADAKLDHLNKIRSSAASQHWASAMNLHLCAWQAPRHAANTPMAKPRWPWSWQRQTKHWPNLDRCVRRCHMTTAAASRVWAARRCAKWQAPATHTRHFPGWQARVHSKSILAEINLNSRLYNS